MHHVPAAPFSFCAGASSRGVPSACNLLSIDACCLWTPPLRVLLAKVLLALISTQGMQQQQKQQQAAALLLKGLAAHGPPGALDIARSLSKDRTDLQDFTNGAAPAFGSTAAAAGSVQATATAAEVQAPSAEALVQDAAVAVLLLLARCELSALSCTRPSMEAILEDSQADAVVDDLRLAAAAATEAAAENTWPTTAATAVATDRTASGGTACPLSLALLGLHLSPSSEAASADWLLLLLRSLCCCLRVPQFANRALAARTLSSFILQTASTHGSRWLLEALAAIAATAAQAYQAVRSDGCEMTSSRRNRLDKESAAAFQDATPGSSLKTQRKMSTSLPASHWRASNARSGLLLVLVETLTRPESRGFLSEADTASNSCLLLQLKQSFANLEVTATRSTTSNLAALEDSLTLKFISALETVLALQAVHLFASAAPQSVRKSVHWLAVNMANRALGIVPFSQEGNGQEFDFYGVGAELKIDASRFAEAAIGKDSFTSHLGTPTVQAASLRVLVCCQLRAPAPAAAAPESAKPSAWAAEAVEYMLRLGRVSLLLRAALSLAVHPQALEEALTVFAKETKKASRQWKRRQQMQQAEQQRNQRRHTFIGALPGSIQGGLLILEQAAADAASSVEPQKSFPVCGGCRGVLVDAKVVDGFQSVWAVCLGLLEDPLSQVAQQDIPSVLPNSAVTGVRLAVRYWNFCFLRPLRVAACKALGALAMLAVAFERVCCCCFGESPERLCGAVVRARTAAAAAALQQKDVSCEASAAAWTRLGAALLGYADSEGSRARSWSGLSRNNNLPAAATAAATIGGTQRIEAYGIAGSCHGVEVAAEATEQQHLLQHSHAAICFAAPSTRWALLWVAELLQCAQPTRSLKTRMQAAKVRKLLCFMLALLGGDIVGSAAVVVAAAAAIWFACPASPVTGLRLATIFFKEVSC